MIFCDLLCSLKPRGKSNLLETQASRLMPEVIGDLRSRIFMAPVANAKQRSCQMKATG